MSKQTTTKQSHYESEFEQSAIQMNTVIDFLLQRTPCDLATRGLRVAVEVDENFEFKLIHCSRV